MIQVSEPYFDCVAEAFTRCVRYAADWEVNYDGYSKSDKIKQAIQDLKFTITGVEQTHELKGLE